MEIFFETRRLAKEFSTDLLLTKRHGPRRAQLIKRRLGELQAADTLEDLRNLPGPRCHELRGNRAEQLSLDLDHPYRLIIVPANIPIPRKADSGLDWKSITAVRIIGVEDTHE